MFTKNEKDRGVISHFREFTKNGKDRGVISHFREWDVKRNSKS